MENNTKRIINKALIVLVLLGTSMSCGSCRRLLVDQEIAKKKSILESTVINEVDKFIIEDCLFNWKTDDRFSLADLVHANLDDLYCIRRSARQGNLKSIRALSLLIRYYEMYQPLDYLKLNIFENVQHAELFEALIEILQYETEEEFMNGVIRSPVHVAFGLRLIEPMIDLIDGIPKYEYMKNSEYQYAYNCSAAEYYMQIKTLWQEGRITLKAQSDVHKR